MSLASGRNLFIFLKRQTLFKKKEKATFYENMADIELFILTKCAKLKSVKVY